MSTPSQRRRAFDPTAMATLPWAYFGTGCLRRSTGPQTASRQRVWAASSRPVLRALCRPKYAGKEEPNFFAKLFSSDKDAAQATALPRADQGQWRQVAGDCAEQSWRAGRQRGGTPDRRSADRRSQVICANLGHAGRAALAPADPPALCSLSARPAMPGRAARDPAPNADWRRPCPCTGAARLGLAQLLAAGRWPGGPGAGRGPTQPARSCGDGSTASTGGFWPGLRCLGWRLGWLEISPNWALLVR